MTNLKTVFDTFLDDYLKMHQPSPEQASVLTLLRICRTQKLGTHANTCENCGKLSIAYNSCRNRHCPLCQSLKREMWRFDRNADLLNTHYFHIVFTVPDRLNPLFYNNQRLLYSLLMKSAAQAVSTLAASRDFLEVQVGLTGILHTWGQTLSYHPHVHFIVPGGGLSLKSGLWKPSSKKFFLPVRALADTFRGIFLKGLKDLVQRELLYLSNNEQPLRLSNIQNLLDWLYLKDFVVSTKESLDSPTHVINYLCQYTHRVAIANNRILKVSSDGVTFKYKDNRDSGKTKLMTLSGPEFIRRFLMHVLPKRFVKIRHYGFLAGRNRPTKLALCRKRMNLLPSKTSKDFSTAEFIEAFLSLSLKCCSDCNGAIRPLVPT